VDATDPALDERVWREQMAPLRMEKPDTLTASPEDAGPTLPEPTADAQA
jgi:hypothetical protein